MFLYNYFNFSRKKLIKARSASAPFSLEDGKREGNSQISISIAEI